jgi:hypothetical protein
MRIAGHPVVKRPSVHSSEAEFNGIGGLLTYIGDGPRLSNRRR